MMILEKQADQIEAKLISVREKVDDYIGGVEGQSRAELGSANLGSGMLEVPRATDR